MKLQSVLLAGAVLVSSLAQATPAERPEMLPSTVCYPAVAALQEPTTEDNLTPYDPFTSVDDQLYLEDSLYPDAEPTTIALATIILKEIGKVVGTKIYESIFRDGSKQTLTKADFDRIAQIVKEALRDDAKRKLNECVINLQDTNKFLATTWDKDIAMDAYTTSQAVVSNIAHFDHLWSRLGMMPSAFLISSLNMGLTQELLKRDSSKSDSFFEGTKDRSAKILTRVINKHAEKLLNESDQWVRFISGTGKVCGSEGEGYCFSVHAKFWGKTYYYHSERCPLYPEGQEYCDARFQEHLTFAKARFVEEVNKMYKLVYGDWEPLKCRPCSTDKREYTENVKRILALPARQPAYTPYVKISPPRPSK